MNFAISGPKIKRLYLSTNSTRLTVCATCFPTKLSTLSSRFSYNRFITYVLLHPAGLLIGEGKQIVLPLMPTYSWHSVIHNFLVTMLLPSMCRLVRV